MPHKLLIAFLLLMLASSVASIYVDSSRETAKRDAFYQEQEATRSNDEPTFAGPYCFPDRHPEKLTLIACLSFMALLGAFITTSKIVLALLSASPFAVFAYWYYDTQRLLKGIESSVSVEGVDSLIYRANGFDIAGLFLILFIVAWQVGGLLFAISRPANEKLV